MGAHEHGPVELPGGPVDAEGRAVNEALLAALTGAAVNGCMPCVESLLDEVAAEPACVARLVEVSRLTGLRFNRGELPPFMTEDDDPSGPAAPEFKRLVRAITAAEPVAELCEQMPPAQRRAAAGYAIELLVGQLTLANSFGFDDGETLAEMCCAIGGLLVEWWFATAPLARREFTEAWERYAFGHREAGLPGDGVHAVALLLGALLHQQARTDHVTVADLGTLVFTRVLPVLASPDQAGAVLSAFAAPGADDVTVPVKRFARSSREFLTELCTYARHTISVHVRDCPHGLRDTDHACTLAHRGPALDQGADAYVAAPIPEEGQRVALPTIGYREPEPVEDAPAGHSLERLWQINAAQILLERWDADTARWNEKIADDSSISEPTYAHETGLEPFACPACGSRASFLVEGRWGDPLTLHCRCGVTVMSPLDGRPDDLGRRLLKRLILCEADPAYAARRLLQPVMKCHESEQQDRTRSTYDGPRDEDVAVVEAADRSDGDLVEVLTAALKPRLPERHGGRALTLLLLQVLDALSAPAVRDSGDGQDLAAAAHALMADLKEESDRWAPTREPVVDRLKAWQAEGGPQLWQDAWSRTLAMAGRSFARYRVANGRITDGCAGLTLALYVLAREADTGVDQVTMDDIRSLMSPAVAGAAPQDLEDLPRRWGERLAALGHDLDAADDPVTAAWRHLSTDRPIHTYGDGRAPALALGLETLLGERSYYRVIL